MSYTVTMRPPTAKNKSANPVQVTAEQIMIDAQIHADKPLVKQDEKVRDEEELADLKQIKRKEYEEKRSRYHTGQWIKYAQWEERLQEFRRARSVYERCLEIEYKNPSVWLKYIEMEMRHKFINHARNLYERVIEILPRVEQFWFKYCYMEEIIGNYAKTRQIFQRWMEWRPPEKAWLAFIGFEKRMKEPQNQKNIMYQYMDAYPKLAVYLRVARFEIKNREKSAARKIYEDILENLGEEALQESYFIEFATFEIKNKEYERSREIFKFGLQNIHKEKSKKLYEEYLTFEKQFGQKDEIDMLILTQRRALYKEILAKNQNNYDTWFDLCNLEIATQDHIRIRDTFEAAVKQIPPIQEKRYWRRYMYLWYTYAIFEELEAEDNEKAQSVYERALKVIPHKSFTFAKLWINYSHFQLRNDNLEKARKIFGNAIGKCSSEKIFNEYIEMELQLANIDRVRSIYSKFVELFPDHPTAWIKWAELERSLDEVDRFRSIFEIAIQNQNLNQPETVWKAYIDNEIDSQEYDKVRELYVRLLEITKHVKIYVSYAQFEESINQKDNCRQVFQQAENYFKENQDLKEERALLLEAWLSIEKKFGDQEEIEKLQKKQPEKIKKQRQVKLADPTEEEQTAMEEYWDYVFPGDQNTQGIMKMLGKAHEWKKQQQAIDDQ